MAKYYFSSSTGSNTTGDGSIGNPWANFSGKKSATNALSPDDFCYFKAGDIWYHQEVIVDSNGTAGHPITIDRYGIGNDPIFCWSTITTGWTLEAGGNNIYSKTGLYQYAGTVGVDGTSSLYSQTYLKTPTTIDAGCYLNSSGTIYIRLANNSDPAGHTIYVPTGDQSIDRGVVGGSKARGSYVNINHIKAIYAQRRNFCFSQPHSSFNDCTGIGATNDNFLLNGYTPNGEMASYCSINRCYSSYGVSGGVGGYSINGGGGQGITVGSDHSWVTWTHAEYSWAAGIDFLDYSTDTDVHHGGAIYNTCNNNGQAVGVTSMYDPGIYVDGGHDLLLYGNTCYASGAGTQTRDADNIKVTSENAGRNVSNVYIINNSLRDAAGYNLEIDKGSSTVMPGMVIANNTLVKNSNTYEGSLLLGGLSTTGTKAIFKNNILVKLSGAKPLIMWSDMSSTKVDSNYNYYYDSGLNGIYSGTDATGINLTSMQSTLTNDANSVQGDPYLINTTFATFDAHLQRVALGQAHTSGAIGIGLDPVWTPPQWITDAVILANNGAVVGSTRSDGVASSATDLGFHSYTPTPTGSLTSTNVQPATLYLNSVNTDTITFTTANALPSDGKIVITYPISLGGFTFNSGGSSVATFNSGGDGSLSVSITGSIVTLTRSGGTSIAASQAVSISLTNVLNPPQTGTTGAYQIKTTTSADATIDIDSNVSADQIISPLSGFITITISGVTMSNIKFNV